MGMVGMVGMAANAPAPKSKPSANASPRPTYTPKNGVPEHLFQAPPGLDKDDRWHPPTWYICGEGCKEQILLKYNDPVRCRECGCRILYKAAPKNDKRQFEAR